MEDLFIRDEMLGAVTDKPQDPPSSPPAISRLLKRSPVRDCDEAKALVNGRRESFLQDRRDRLAQRRHAHDQVLARARVDVPAKLQTLRGSLSAAQTARNAIYAQIAANGSKELAKVQLVVSQNKEKVRLEREAKKLAIEMKLTEAQSRREHALQNRRVMRRIRFRRDSASTEYYMDCGTLSPEAQINPTIAATRLQRLWRAHLATRRARRFISYHLNYETVGSIPFDVVADVIKGKDILREAGRIVATLGLDQCSPGIPFDALCRTFLSTFMIIGHPREILRQSGALEDRLSEQAKLFSIQFTKWIESTAQRRLCVQKKVWTHWNAFLSAFEAWKQDDSASLLEVMVAQYCELDLIYQIVKSDSDPIVAAEYHTAIKENQLSLLARIRRIASNQTVPLIRKAISSARRKRLPRRERQRISDVCEEEMKPEGQVKSTTMDAVQFFSIGHRQTLLDNRQLIHEISLDPMYQITKPQRNAHESQVEDSMKRNFFASLQTEMRAGRCVSWIPIVVQECKMRLLRLVMPKSPTFAAINADFDIPLIEAQCRQNCYDYLAFTTRVVNMMLALCSPARDGMVTDIELLRGFDDVDLFAKRVNSIFEVLDVLLLDSANFHLAMSIPKLLPEAISYEQKKFQEDLTSGVMTLNKTKHLLNSQMSELRLEAALRDPEEIGLPSEMLSPHRIFITTLARLLTSSEDLPETLVLDHTRLACYRADFLRIIKTTAYLMTARNLMTSKQRNLNLLTWTSLQDRLSILLCGQDIADTTSIAAEINHHLDLAYTGPEEDRQYRHTTLSNLIKSTDSSSSVLKLFTRRLQSLLLTRMSGAELSGTKIAAAGFEDLSNDVQDLSRNMAVLARVNWSCYRHWYEKSLSE